MTKSSTDTISPSAVTYTDLQRSVDELVGRFGLAKSVEIINSFSKNTRIGKRAAHKLKLIKDYIFAEAILVFDLQEQHFFTSEFREYREARMACYHLLDKYTKNSHATIAEAFGKKRGSAFYYIHKCDEILSIPQYYRAFTDKYKLLESSTIDFIAKLK